MKHVARAAAIWIPLALSGLGASPQSAAQQPPADDDFRQHVVTIYSQDQRLLGAGTAISFSGLILTAKHILEDGSEAGSRAPNYRLNFLVGTQQSTELRNAEVVLVHPFMDLAILFDKSGKPIPPMKLANPERPALKTPVTMIGHRQGAPAPALYVVRTGNIDALDHHGHILVGRGAEVGFSGGPLIQNGQLIGVIRNSGIDQATAVPINNSARDYLRLHGIPIEEGLARRVDDISTLASRVSLYESILLDIQSDVSWRVRLAPKWSGAPETSAIEDLEIHVWYDKKLSSQPTFDARLTVNAVPILDAKAAKPAALTGKSFSRADWLTSSRSPAKFDKFERDLKSLGFKLQDIVGFDVELMISSLVAEESSESKGFLRAPGDMSRLVCFQLRYSRDGKRFQQPIEGAAVPCSSRKPRSEAN